ncbi:hypothetical protein QBC47DRAFT_23512 [Echria macrotheca]|uniref:Uncharacterized protein n=1 Tax=Echria macrotheca TaxID=438768 RepID=A0AAJ0FGM4_9PEZI|nr:hypothetical protein QBC47DRAFT_23512 [Echria macrotheca]
MTLRRGLGGKAGICEARVVRKRIQASDRLNCLVLEGKKRRRVLLWEFGFGLGLFWEQRATSGSQFLESKSCRDWGFSDSSPDTGQAPLFGSQLELGEPSRNLEKQLLFAALLGIELVYSFITAFLPFVIEPLFPPQVRTFTKIALQLRTCLPLGIHVNLRASGPALHSPELYSLAGSQPTRASAARRGSRSDHPHTSAALTRFPAIRHCGEYPARRGPADWM